MIKVSVTNPRVPKQAPPLLRRLKPGSLRRLGGFGHPDGAVGPDASSCSCSCAVAKACFRVE
jgi:hypothetical protein